MSSILDQTGDSSLAQLRRISTLYGLPDFVKSAQGAELLQPEALPGSVYADPRTRQFPCNTKAACWLSWTYFLENRSELSPKVAGWVEQALHGFSNYWGLSNEVQRLQSVRRELEKTADSATPDSMFALVVLHDDGRKVRDLPLRNPLEVKAASEWFQEQCLEYPYEWRQKIASKILARANELGAAVDYTFLERKAGHGMCRHEEAAQLIRSRVALADKRADAQLKAEMLKLADSVQGVLGLCVDAEMKLTSEPLVKLAGVIDAFDRRTGIRYNAQTLPPEDVLFRVTFKEAENLAQSSTSTRTGYVYAHDDLSRLPLEDVRGFFGDQLASEVASGFRVDGAKLGEAASKLAYPDAKLLDRVLQEHHISPIAQQPHQQPRLGHEDWLKLAAANV